VSPRPDRPLVHFSARVRPWVLAWVAGVSSALGATGCSPSCGNESDPPVRFAGGITDAARLEYQTNPFDEPFLDFPAKRTYDLVHGLRGAPTLYQAYVAFEPDPYTTSGSAAIASGNEVLFRIVDSEIVRVENDTCQHFYLRVVASLAEDDAADAGDAGAQGDGGDAGDATDAGDASSP
jgi:hypothetical protein